jgi:hypothetical protein
MPSSKGTLQAAVPGPGLKEGTEVAKNLFDILKSLLLVIAILILVFDRGLLGRILDRMNASKIAIGSITVERDAVAASIRANADALPKTQEALRAANRELATLKQGYENATNALRASETAVSDLQSRFGGATLPPSVARARDLSRPVLAQARGRLQSADRATEQVKTASASAAVAISDLPGARNTGAGFGIVFGGHRNNDSASRHLDLGRNLGGGLHLFLRSGIYRSVAVFPSRQAAYAAVPGYRRLPSASGAYVVNLGSWCPGVEPATPVVDCGL